MNKCVICGKDAGQGTVNDIPCCLECYESDDSETIAKIKKVIFNE